MTLIITRLSLPLFRYIVGSINSTAGAWRAISVLAHVASSLTVTDRPAVPET